MDHHFGDSSDNGHPHNPQHHYPANDNHPDIELDDNSHDEDNPHFDILQNRQCYDDGYEGLVTAPISSLDDDPEGKNRLIDRCLFCRMISFSS